MKPDGVPASLLARVEELLDGIDDTVEGLEGRIRQITSVERGERGWAVCVAGVVLEPHDAPADADRDAERLVRGLALAHRILSKLDRPLAWEEVVSAVADAPAQRFDLGPAEALRVHQAAIVLDALVHEGRVLRAAGPDRLLDSYVASGLGWRARAATSQRNLRRWQSHDRTRGPPS